VSKPYAQRAQVPVTCENCEHFRIVEAWIERDDVYLDLEECPECKAPYDLDILASNVTVIR
jgi:hypothetical protein